MLTNPATPSETAREIPRDTAPETSRPRATLHERVERERAEQAGPAHSTGAGSTRLAALLDAAKARLSTKD